MKQLAHIQEALGPELLEMNNIISQTLRTSNSLMNDIVQRYLETKGKQIRPILVLLSAKMFGNVTHAVLQAGAALEMLHNASLIHDDVVDETLLRRGVDTINARMGNHIAVLVGDFFVSNALAAAIRTGSISVVEALSDLGKELSLGEIEQLDNARGHEFEEQSYFRMIRQKTASLFMNCVRMGADTVNAPKEVSAPLVRYAELLGLCFQIRDDIFDYFPDPRIGKPSGNDLREGKVTLPLIHALKVAPHNEASRMHALLLRGDLSSEEIDSLLNFAIANGGIEYARSKMLEMQREADEIIMRYPDSPSRRAFREIFDFIISRNY